MNKDLINSPAYYMGKVECIDALESAMSSEELTGFLKGNIFKYLWRTGKKERSSPIEDLKKAQWYLNKLIELVEESNK